MFSTLYSLYLPFSKDQIGFDRQFLCSKRISLIRHFSRQVCFAHRCLEWLIERSDKFNQESICKLHTIHMWSKLILVFCQNICVSHTNLTWYFSNWNTVKRRGNSSFFTLTPPLTYINLLLLSRPNRKSGYLLCPIKKLQINKLLLI